VTKKKQLMKNKNSSLFRCFFFCSLKNFKHALCCCISGGD